MKSTAPVIPTKPSTVAEGVGNSLVLANGNSRSTTSHTPHFCLHLALFGLLSVLIHLFVVCNASDVFSLFITHPVADQQNHHSNGLPIAVVFYSLINPSHRWRELLTLQMAELTTFGIASRALSIHVELSTDGDIFSPPNSKNQTMNVLDLAAKIVQALVPKAKVTVGNNNTFEYPGIHRVWELANLHPNLPPSTILLYLHGKGTVNGDPDVIRTVDNERLTRIVIKPWKDIVEHFEKRTELMKAGYALASSGHVWYNFFWVRSSYVRRLDEPVIDMNRYYYEGWLGGRLKPCNNDTGEPLKLTGKDGEPNHTQADAQDGLSLCGNDESKLGVAYEALAMPGC
jgi:hypothetical protein